MCYYLKLGSGINRKHNLCSLAVGLEFTALRKISHWTRLLPTPQTPNTNFHCSLGVFIIVITTQALSVLI